MAASADLTLDAALKRIRDKPVSVGSFINIGAGRGEEMRLIDRFWPGARALMIDMDARFEADWKKLAARFPGVKHTVCAAGSADAQGYFRKTDEFGGTLSGDAGGAATAVRSIDSLVREHALPAPYFLKFDTHGAELDILAGARETLAQTSLVMMEVYNFKLGFVGGRNLTFDEMSLHMKSLGFRCVDMCEPLFRPKDAALWQFHMFFIRADHPIWKAGGFNQEVA